MESDGLDVIFSESASNSKIDRFPVPDLAHAVVMLGKGGAPINCHVILVILVETNKYEEIRDCLRFVATVQA